MKDLEEYEDLNNWRAFRPKSMLSSSLKLTFKDFG